MKFVLLCPASTSERWVTEAQALYTQKITPIFKIEIEEPSGKSQGRSAAGDKKKSDNAKILEKIKQDDYVIAFDENGDKPDSKKFSKAIELALNSSRKRIVLVVGGAYGLDDEVRKRADRVISLGAMTMNHLLAKVVVLEQTYRALSILRNLPYHNE